MIGAVALDTFYSDPDPRGAEHQRRERARHGHTIPRLRAFGFALLSALVVFHTAAVADRPQWAETFALVGVMAGYSVASWLMLRAWFDRVKAFNLGLFFLAVDLVVF